MGLATTQYLVTLFPEGKEEDDNNTSLGEMMREHSSKGCVGGAVKCTYFDGPSLLIIVVHLCIGNLFQW